MKIRDKITLGTLVGTIATIPQLIFNILAVHIGLSEHYAVQYAASILIDKDHTYSAWGILFGLVTWESMAAGLGVITVFLIYLTGRDCWWIKGLLVSNCLMFIFIYGFYFGIEAPRIIPFDLGSNWAFYIENTVFGITAGYLAARWLEPSKV